MALDVLGRGEAFRLGLGNVALEVGLGPELLQSGARLGVAEEVLGEENDEADIDKDGYQRRAMTTQVRVRLRLAVVTVDLATEGVAARLIISTAQKGPSSSSLQDVGLKDTRKCQLRPAPEHRE